MTDANDSTAAGPAIAAITAFVPDLAAAKDFYGRVFDLPVHFEDDASAVFRFGVTMVNLLVETAAPELLGDASVAPREAGHRFQLTLEVDDVDAAADRLRALGVPLVLGPVDRPWGIRTVSFTDPGGHLWEFAGPVPAR